MYNQIEFVKNVNDQLTNIQASLYRKINPSLH